MVDEEVVRARLLRLEIAVKHLETMASKPKDDFLSTWELHGLAERDLEIAAQSCVDIAHHLIASDGLRTPDGYGDAFQVLVEADILDQDHANRMKSIAGLRNILVHEYLAIDHEMLLNQIRDLSDFTLFAQAIRKAVWG